MRRDDPFSQVTVPDYSVLAKGTLRSILRDVEMSIEELIELLQRSNKFKPIASHNFF